MDSILSDLASYHDNSITYVSPFFVAGLPHYFSGHNTACTAKNKGLTQIVLVKNKRTVYRWYPAFVSPVFNPLSHPLENPFRVEKPRRDCPLVIRGRKAEDICIENELRSHTGAEGIPIYPHDPGERATIGIKG